MRWPSDRLPFRHQAFYDQHRVELRLGLRATRIDAGARRVSLSDGETLAYDRLMLCTGARSRLLTCPGAELAGVHYLRGIADVEAMRPGLKAGSRVVIIGGGYIGLETAATARKLGCTVTVLEMADRVMNRVVASSVSEYFAHEHRTQGIKIICNTRVVRLEGAGRVERVVCADGSSYEADLLVVGVGAVPELRARRRSRVSPARTASRSMSTAAPAMRPSMPPATAPTIPRCASKCACGSNRSTMRSSRQRQPRSTCSAGRPCTTACPGSGRISSTTSCSSSGSRRASISRCCAAIRPRAASASATCKGGELLAVEAINHPKDYVAARKLIAERARPDLDKLADPGRALERCGLMPRIVFIERGGARREVRAPDGVTVMEVARQHGIDGIVAQCGGACACATCHVYVAPPWLGKLEPREDMEEGMLESAWEPRANSRLSCQIHVSAALDGLEVTVPERQSLIEDDQ